MEELLEKIDKDIKSKLSEKRYTHSVNVMKRAEELAKKYGVPVEKAKVVALAHDIAKEMPYAEALNYVKENNIELDEMEKNNPKLLHAKIGADICKERYGFSKDMQDAIKFHTVGDPKMDDLAKIIFIADKTEEGRSFIDFETVKQKEKEGLNKLLIYTIDVSIMYMIKKGQLMHPNSIYTRNYFLFMETMI